MFADPQTITYSGAAKTLPAIGRSAEQSTYQVDDSGVKYNLTIGHQFKARNRVVVRLQRDAYSADPLVPTNYVLASMTGTLTLDFPRVGVSAVDAQLLGKALAAWATDANLLKVVNGET